MRGAAFALFAGLLCTAGCDGLWDAFLRAQPDTLIPIGRHCVGTNPYWIAIGDINKDGFADLAVMNHGNLALGKHGSITLFIGKGRGRFSLPFTIDFSDGMTMPTSGALADLDSDGFIDLAVATVTSGTTGQISIFWGLPDGNLAPEPSTPIMVPGRPTAVSIGDVDRDSYNDLMVSFDMDNSGMGSGGYQAFFGTSQRNIYRISTQSMVVNGYSSLVKVVDLNVDNIPEVTIGGGNLVRAYDYVASSLSQIYSVDTDIQYSVSNFDVADLNSDSLPDIVVGEFDKNQTRDARIATYINNLTAYSLVKEPISLPNYKQSFPLAVGDFNKDSESDLIVGWLNPSNQQSELLVFFGKEDGTMSKEAKPLAMGSGARYIAVGDLNGDGIDDVAATGTTSNQISLFLGTKADEPLRNIDPEAIDQSPKDCN